jgi:hypothetical protein
MGRAGAEMIGDMLRLGGLLLCGAPDLSLIRLCALWLGLILLLAVPYLWASRRAPKPVTDDPPSARRIDLPGALSADCETDVIR